jgi:hypothetical protein
MKPLLPPLACAIVVAALLYGALCAAERRLPESEDPWLDAWMAEGMKAEFQSISSEPAKHLPNGDVREVFQDPKLAGTVLRSYLVQNAAVHVVQLPGVAAAPAFPQGRSLDFRLKPQGRPIHLCRSGRLLLLVSNQGKWVPFMDSLKTPKREVEQIFDVFEETAKRHP